MIGPAGTFQAPQLIFTVSANKDQLLAKGLFDEEWSRSHPKVPNRVYRDFLGVGEAQQTYERLRSMGLMVLKNWLT